MAGYYTESNYENAVIQLLTETLGYSYAYGPDIDRDYHDPLYEDLLLPALQRINPGLPMEALNEAAYKIKNFETGILLQKNMTFTDYMQSGVPVKYFMDGEEQSALVYLDLHRLYAVRCARQIFHGRRGAICPGLSH